MKIGIETELLSWGVGVASGIIGKVIQNKWSDGKRHGKIEERCAAEQRALEESRVSINNIEDRLAKLEQGFTDCQTARDSHFDGYSKFLCAKLTEFEKRIGLEIRAAVAEAVSKKKKRGGK